jgi:hypothetical protein
MTTVSAGSARCLQAQRAAQAAQPPVSQEPELVPAVQSSQEREQRLQEAEDTLKNCYEGTDLAALEAAAKLLQDLGGLTSSDGKQAVGDRVAELRQEQLRIRRALEDQLKVRLISTINKLSSLPVISLCRCTLKLGPDSL